MRIAISGTHASGKSTLIDAFAARHPEYTCEPEPYVVLQELYGEAFDATPTIEDFERQLEYQCELLTRYSTADNAIFERSPVDFLAYMLSIDDRAPRADEWISTVRTALERIDLLVYLPLDERSPIHVPDDEDPVLREEVDHRLREILFGDEFDIWLIEARGSVADRLHAIERAMKVGI